VVVKLDGSDKIEVAEGSFVWLKDTRVPDGDVFLEWDDIKESDQGAILDIKSKIDSLTEELAKLVVTLSNKDAA
jgi:tyrosyl-tRNA synthetase